MRRRSRADSKKGNRSWSRRSSRAGRPEAEAGSAAAGVRAGGKGYVGRIDFGYTGADDQQAAIVPDDAGRYLRSGGGDRGGGSGTGISRRGDPPISAARHDDPDGLSRPSEPIRGQLR